MAIKFLAPTHRFVVGRLLDGHYSRLALAGDEVARANFPALGGALLLFQLNVARGRRRQGAAAVAVRDRVAVAHQQRVVRVRASLDVVLRLMRRFSGFRLAGFWVVLVLVLCRLGVAYVVLLLPLGAPVLKPYFHLS